MERFSYKGQARLGVLYLQLCGGIAILLTTALLIWVLILVIPRGSEYSGGACIAGWIFMVGWTVGLVMINFYPTIWLSDQGLTVSTFPFGRVFVPWTDIVDVSDRLPFGGDLVRTRRLTPFHRVFGWLYSRTLLPSFVIGQDMAERERLLHDIRRRILSTEVR